MWKSRKPLSKARRVSRVAVWAALGVVLLLRYAVFPPDPEFPVVPSLTFWRHEEPPPPQRRRYRPTELSPPRFEVPKDLLRLQIEIAAKDVATLQAYFWNGWRGAQQDRPEVLATVREGGTVYPRVAVHLKGAAGSFRPFDDKPALTLNFAKHEPGRRFHGYSKLSLNNSVQDPTFLCEAICREMFEAAGVPVPRADFATVLINGVDKGLYVLTEGYNKDFLRRYFRNVKGNLYDGGFVQDIHPGLKLNSGDSPEDHSDLERLLAAAAIPEATNRWDRLGQVLDLDRFITVLALEILMCHWDGYALNRNNYRLFHDLESDRLIFMPHGLDQMFDWPPGRFPAEGPIHPAMRGLVAQAVISTPQGSSRYLERLGTLCTNRFNERAITNRVQELARRIAPTLAAYGPEIARRHEVMVASLCDRIGRRFQSVAEQLNAPREPLPFDADGTAHPNGWWPRPGPAFPGFSLQQMEADGRTVLRIAVERRRGTASWRTRVFLEGGAYRFEGRVRAGEGGEGGQVCLRASGVRVTPQPLTGADWVLLGCELRVEEPLVEVQLVCEFSGQQGEAWFDLESLRLVRLPREP